MSPWIDKGYGVVALVRSCALMLKFEWSLILPDDIALKKLAAATLDVSEYIVALLAKWDWRPVSSRWAAM